MVSLGDVAGTYVNGDRSMTLVLSASGALSGTAFTINGTNIEVGAAADAATRLSDLVTAINAQTSTTGVTASTASGVLTLSSSGGTGEINIGGTDTAVVLAQTGLTVGDHAATPGAAQTGFSALNISSTTGARKSSSTSTPSTAATGPRWPPP